MTVGGHRAWQPPSRMQLTPTGLPRRHAGPGGRAMIHGPFPDLCSTIPWDLNASDVECDRVVDCASPPGGALPRSVFSRAGVLTARPVEFARGSLQDRKSVV